MCCGQILFLTFLLVINLSMATPECSILLVDPTSACDFSPLTVISKGGQEVNNKNCGEQFKKEDWQLEPTVIYSAANESRSYTIILVDPDPPNYPRGQYYLHWLVNNAFGDDLRTGNLSKASVPFEYKGPVPKNTSELHRYMFFVFKEYNFNQKLLVPIDRENFKFLRWLKLQFEDICGPEAGTEFTIK